MGYTLVPRNKAMDPLELGAFSWPWILEEGVGLIVGYVRGSEPGKHYTFTPKGRKGTPITNDGFYVTAFEARAMAQAAWHLAETYRLINAEWEKLPDEEKEARWNGPLKHLYRRAIRYDFIEKAGRFADWAEQSRGFWIW